jgi:hypothetical protein
MAITESGLRNQQQMALINAAREALDRGRPIDALSLAERVSGFWHNNLVTIMGVFCTHPTEETQRRALTLFRRKLAECSRSSDLVHPALWVRNPKRSWLPAELKQEIDNRRRSLEPNWDGIWHDPGLGESNKVLSAKASKSPEQVFDPDLCLSIAGQTQNWNPWFARYRALGGSLENPKYLRVWIGRTARRGREPTPEVKAMLRKYAEVGNFGEVRALLRHITPVRRSLKGKDPNWALAKYELLVYCGWERLEHDVEDWVHIARSALYLRHAMIQRIAQRGLAGIVRTPTAHQIFEELTAMHGQMRITGDAKEDIGPRGNPIWQSIYPLLPIDGNARKILIEYSRSEAEAS